MARRIERSATRYARDQPPSFSSSLLDAIYRSIDECDARGAPESTKRTPLLSANPVTDKPVTSSRRQTRESWTTVPVSETSAGREFRNRSADAVSEKLVTGLRRGASVRCTGPAVRGKAVTRSRSRYPESTSSSSDASSYNGFSSSSDPDSSVRPTRLRPIRTGLAPEPTESRSDPMVAEKKKGKPGSLRSRLKPLSSPGARLASFLNSLFSAASRNPKKPTSSAAAGATADPASAQILGKRSMVAVGCAAAAAARGREARKTVEEMLRRRFAREMGFENDDVASDASSDLFELENLTVSGRSYRDELPVYGSTNLKSDGVVVRRCTPLREETKK